MYDTPVFRLFAYLLYRILIALSPLSDLGSCYYSGTITTGYRIPSFSAAVRIRRKRRRLTSLFSARNPCLLII
jgi:hypothetical protein